MNTTTTHPATPRQIAYLHSLASERPAWAHIENIHPDTIDRMSKKDASYWIGEALKEPREATPATPEAPEPPAVIHYLPDTNRIIRVVRSKAGRLYCTELVVNGYDGTRSWDYLGVRPMASLSLATVMTLDQMRAHGHHTGFCVRCNAELSDPGSVANGIGPVCIKKATEELIALGVMSAPPRVLVSA